MSVRLPSALTPAGTVTEGSGPEGEETGRSALLNAIDRFGDYWMLGVFVVMVLVFGFLSPAG